MNGRKFHIDCILVNKECPNSLDNSEVYICFSIVGRDHSLVTTKVKVSFRMWKIPARKVQSSQHFAIMISNKSV